MTESNSPVRRKTAGKPRAEKPVPAPDVGERPHPPLTLLLGPSGAGKTETVLTRFCDNGGRALLVVPSPPQADACAHRLAERLGKPLADVRGAVLTLHGLAAEINRGAPADGIRSIGRSFQRLALGEIFPAVIRPDDFLGRMRDAPGFVGALAERLREWKLACVTPDDLEAGAETVAAALDEAAFARKAAELARLFRAYETFLLQNRLRDEEDGLRLAAERVANLTDSPLTNINLVCVDGFYRFNRAQRLLLAAVAGRGLEFARPEIDVVVTLPYEADRPLPFAAPERTLNLLRAEFAVRETTLAPRPADRPCELAVLERRLFGTTEPPLSDSPSASPPLTLHRQEPKTQPASDVPSPLLPPLVLFDAPNPYVEAEMTARAFRRLYDAGGYVWDDFAVILRTMGDYAPILSAVFERYGIPLGVDGPEKLAENPLLATLLHLLAVVRWGWRRDDVPAFLKSGYTAPDKLAADALRRRAKTAGVREGRERWLKLLAHAEDDSVAAVLHEMARYDALLTRGQAPPEEFAALVREIIVQFDLEARIDLGERTRQERDRTALKEALDVMQDVVQMAALSGRAMLSFAEFHEELLAAWEQTTSLAPVHGDVVRIVEPYDSRERPIKVAAVMGLTERVFPRRITEDPFLRDDERAALRRTLGLDLEEQKGRADDERFFFYLAVTAPSERLILSYPRSSDEADTLPSFYLDEVRAVFGPGAETPEAGEEGRMESGAGLCTVSRTLADVAPRPEEVVSESDGLLAACADLFDPGSESDSAERARRMRQAAALMEHCLADTERREAVRAVVASRCLPRLPRLEDADLRAEFSRQDRVYSVSELETYNRCPFQYLLRYALRLRPEEDGVNPTTQGTLLHSVLSRYFRRKGKRAADGPTPDMETTRRELRELLAESLAAQTLDAGPHRLRMTQRLLADALDGFAEREHRFTAQFGMEPAHFELAFGFGAAEGMRIEEEDRVLELSGNAAGALPTEYDPASCAEPLLLHAGGDGPPVAVCGTIDRVDLDVSGQRALALDYKLGKPPDYSDIQRGLSLQMPLYMLAIERLFGKASAVACYDSMQERGRRRFHRVEHVKLQQFAPVIPLENGETVKPLNREQYATLTKTAETAAVQAARGIASARIEATPGDHCRFCAFGDVCRTTVLGGHDGEPPGNPSDSPGF
jgi:ATP-dependent helicase/nuclease subunit B